MVIEKEFDGIAWYLNGDLVDYECELPSVNDCDSLLSIMTIEKLILS